MKLEIEITTVKNTIQTEDGEMGVYTVRPNDNYAYPGLIVLQEVFGINGSIQTTCEILSKQGYTVFAPDLNYRLFKWKQVDYGDKESRMKVIQNTTGTNVMADMGSLLEHISKHEFVQQDKVGVIGYCIGGKIAYLTAAHFPDKIKGAVVYYGAGIPVANEQFDVAPIELTSQIKAPVLGFFGALDSMIPKEHLEKIEQNLVKHGVKHEMYVYSEAGHAFFNNEREDFHFASSLDSWHKMLRWLETNLIVN